MSNLLSRSPVTTEDILFSANILQVILGHLTLSDALRVRTLRAKASRLPKALSHRLRGSWFFQFAASCCTARRLVEHFRKQSGIFQPRLLVCSSKANQVTDIDWFTGVKCNCSQAWQVFLWKASDLFPVYRRDTGCWVNIAST